MNRITVIALVSITYLAMSFNMIAEPAAKRPEINCVLFHTPGPNWKKNLPFQKQPGVMDHVQYMAGQLKEGNLVMGGPFLDNSGGMMIFKGADIKKATEIANADPGVKNGLLKVSVKSWLVAMSNVQPIPIPKKD